MSNLLRSMSEKPIRKYRHSDGWCSGGHEDNQYDLSDPYIVFLDEEPKPKIPVKAPPWAINEKDRHKGVGF